MTGSTPAHDRLAARVGELHDQLAALLAEIDTGALTASSGYRHRLEGAVEVLAELLKTDGADGTG
jgi:hypothetical protein